VQRVSVFVEGKGWVAAHPTAYAIIGASNLKRVVAQ
jgi:hypothetical protein